MSGVWCPLWTTIHERLANDRSLWHACRMFSDTDWHNRFDVENVRRSMAMEPAKSLVLDRDVVLALLSALRDALTAAETPEPAH